MWHGELGPLIQLLGIVVLALLIFGAVVSAADDGTSYIPRDDPDER
jgi:hypothetical protein